MTTPEPLPITIHSSTIHVSQIKAVAEIVDTSGAVEMVESWITEERAKKHPGGRPATISIRTAILLMLALGIEASPLLVTKASHLLCGRLTENAWLELGLPAKEYKKFDRWTEKERWMWYHRLWRTLHTIFGVVDPYPETSNYRRMEKDEYQELKATRDPQLIVRNKKRATVLMNSLVWASVETFGEDRLAEWNGNVSVDGTALTVSRKGNSNRSARVAADPDAGWYVRDGDHASDGYGDKRNIAWTYEATLAAMFGGGFGSKYPALITGIGMDKPGSRIAEKALWALDRVIGSDFKKEFFVGDRAYYPNAAPQNLQIPLRKHGFKIMGDFKRANYGIQGTHSGAVLLDGTWFCPAVAASDRFVNARQDRDTGLISPEEYEEIVEERAPYALQSKGIDKSTGNQRFACPAMGKCPSVSCSLAKKVPSKTKPTAKNPKALLPIMPVNQPKNPGSICSQASITIPLEWEQKESPSTAPKRRTKKVTKKSPATPIPVDGLDQSEMGPFKTIEEAMRYLDGVDRAERKNSRTASGGSVGAPQPKLKSRARKLILDEDGTGRGLTQTGKGKRKTGTFAKFEQQGPLHGSKAWREIYATGRNVIETRN